MARAIITVIGGGSVNWMFGLMKDLYTLEDLEGGQIRLVDPNREHVEAVRDMLLAFNRQQGKDYAVSIVEDRREALRDADFVLMTFSPGAMDAFYNDLEIPVRFGVRMPVSMTCGPCGISAALRTVPVAAEIVEEMEELCPGAWVLNETNPMTAATDAMNRVAEKTHVLGLCHGVHVLPAILERALGLAKPEGMSVLEYMYHWLEEQGFDYAFGGLNHFVFIVRANYRGEDVLPRIRAWAHENRDVSDQPVAEEGQATSFFYNGIQANRIVCDQTGYMPINHDRHTVEFWPGLCNQQTGFGMRWTRKTFVDARRLMKIEQLARIRRIAAGEEELDWSHTGEELTMIMHGILTDTPTRTVVNVPNTGQIPNMPEGTVVESLGKVYADRVEPEFVGDLPGVVGSWNRLHADVVRLTVEAALEGSRDKFIQALSLDPVAGLADFSDLPAMADELLEANRPWLPRFFD